MTTSTLACMVSVNSRNLVPVIVLKHCSRKFSVSITSSPVAGSGRLGTDDAPSAAAAACCCARSWLRFTGFRRAVMAWTLDMGMGWVSIGAQFGLVLITCSVLAQMSRE